MHILTDEHKYSPNAHISKKMLILAFVFGIAAFILNFFKNTQWGTLSIVAIISFYHLIMRVYMRWLVKNIVKEINTDNFWLRQKKYEKKIYKFLCVQAWKNKLPAFAFDYDLNKISSAIRETCIAEITHSIIVLFSYLPLVLIVFYGDTSDIIVFALTSFAAGTFDFAAIIVQRYNRPRMIRISRLFGESNKKRLHDRYAVAES